VQIINGEAYGNIYNDETLFNVAAVTLSTSKATAPAGVRPSMSPAAVI
jgi:hypothetical protein